jgi:DNA glycosylase AlkZ-like
VPDAASSPRLSIRVLNRTLLARQLLLTRVGRPPLEVVEHLVGLQAQVPASPYVGLWSRIKGFEPASLASLLLDRRLVRMALMRGTIHLVSTDDALALRPVVQPVLDWELFRNRTYSRHLEGVDLGPVLDLGRALVDEEPRSLREIRKAMAARWPDLDATTLAYSVRNLLPTVQVTPRGVWGATGDARLTTLEAWVGKAPATDPSPDAAILRYLAAFGPASVADVQAWSRLTGLRGTVERLRPQLTTFRDERGRELFDVPDWLLAEADVPAPVRFLPDYDNVLLSHADRSRIIPEPFRSVVHARIGQPVFLVDGFVAGFWRLMTPVRSNRAGATLLRVEPLVRLRGPAREAVEREATALLAFLAPGAPARVQLVPPA